MKTGVKLRKIDQLIEKFFYNGLRTTNSTPVRVISRYSSSSSSYHHNQHQYDHEKPSTSSLTETMVVIDANGGKKDGNIEDERDNNEILEEKDKTINRDKCIIESNKAVNIRKRKADKIDKDDIMKNEDKKEEEPKPSTSKEVITNLLNFKG